MEKRSFILLLNRRSQAGDDSFRSVTWKKIFYLTVKQTISGWEWFLQAVLSYC